MQAYEELRGATGKEVWFRAPRYEARKLFPQLPPRVQVRTDLYHLRNISLGGIAATCGQSGGHDIPEVGEIVPLSIRQSGLPIFESRARVCRREDGVFGSMVAFNFVDNYIEFEKLMSRNAQAQIVAGMRTAGADVDLVSKDYRMFCADVLRMLRGYRTLLDDAANVAKETAYDFDANTYYDACEDRLIQQWRPLWLAGNDMVRAIANDREVLHATKEFTELVLTPEFRQGAIWDRAYAKPLGYPGDFEVMNYVYSWERMGSNVYAMLLHRLGLECAECVTTRMDVVRQRIAETVQAKGGDQPARILSLGCGSAREVELSLASGLPQSGHAEFTLVDQEDAALFQAFEKSYPHVVRSNGHAHVRCVNMSFTEMLRQSGELSKLPPQDLIYSVGLLDYLNDRRATALTHKLYQSLAPGGLLIIGNMNETPLCTLWPMEYIADWTLHYRNEAQMLAWVRTLQPVMAWTETEATGRVRLMFVRKP